MLEIHKFINFRISKLINWRTSNLQTYKLAMVKFAGLQIRKSTNLRACKLANCKFTNLCIRKLTNLQIYKFARLKTRRLTNLLLIQTFRLRLNFHPFSSPHRSTKGEQNERSIFLIMDRRFANIVRVSKSTKASSNGGRVDAAFKAGNGRSRICKFTRWISVWCIVNSVLCRTWPFIGRIRNPKACRSYSVNYTSVIFIVLSHWE